MADVTKEFNSGNFETEVLKSDKPVLVDFWAEWCGPCRMIAPTVEAIAADFNGKAVVGKLDVDASPDIAQKYGVMTIPTLAIFKDGEMVEKSVGLVNKNKIEALLNENI